ncbi:hypothetical protein McpSp1_03300 [Methanocorpusculaceae archaeon Sp1]|nr:hypothetical protein [Methanocorpusculaceae archaeon Sp1]
MKFLVRFKPKSNILKINYFQNSVMFFSVGLRVFRGRLRNKTETPQNFYPNQSPTLR